MWHFSWTVCVTANIFCLWSSLGRKKKKGQQLQWLKLQCSSLHCALHFCFCNDNCNNDMTTHAQHIVFHKMFVPWKVLFVVVVITGEWKQEMAGANFGATVVAQTLVVSFTTLSNLPTETWWKQFELVCKPTLCLFICFLSFRTVSLVHRVNSQASIVWDAQCAAWKTIKMYLSGRHLRETPELRLLCTQIVL